MKRLLACFLLFVVVWFPACETGVNVSDPELSSSPGELHNEFLAELHSELDARGSSAVSPQDENAVVHDVTNRILSRYGEDPMTHAQIQDALDWGVEIAETEDPWRMLRPLMSEYEYKWLMRYVNETEVHEARAMYEAHCEKYGAPVEGSPLWICLDITIASAEYWYQRRMNESPTKKDGTGPQCAWWRRLIAGVVVCVSDGVAGTLATGGGGLVGGVVVGYLASYAVDSLIEGGSY